MAEVYIATTDAVVNHGGELVKVRRNVTRVADGHPLLAEHPGFFKPADDDVHFGVRTARTEPAVPARGDEPKPDPESEVEESAAEVEQEAEKPQRRSRRS